MTGPRYRAPGPSYLIAPEATPATVTLTGVTERTSVAEDDSERADAILLADADWATGRHTYVEVLLALGAITLAYVVSAEALKRWFFR